MKFFEKHKQDFISFATTNQTFLAYEQMARSRTNWGQIGDSEAFPVVSAWYQYIKLLDDELFPRTFKDENVDQYGFYKLAVVASGSELEVHQLAKPTNRASVK
jgi:hypothetical protein